MKTAHGFTLVETLVTVAIFVAIVGAVGGLFTQVLNFQRRATAAQKVQENAYVVLESLARELRYSSVSGPNGCGATSVTMQHPVNGAVTYAYDAGRGVITRQGQDLTSGDVHITKFQLCIQGAGADQHQVRVTASGTFEARAGASGDVISATVQTTMASRILSDQ